MNISILNLGILKHTIAYPFQTSVSILRLHPHVEKLAKRVKLLFHDCLSCLLEEQLVSSLCLSDIYPIPVHPHYAIYHPDFPSKHPLFLKLHSFTQSKLPFPIFAYITYWNKKKSLIIGIQDVHHK